MAAAERPETRVVAARTTANLVLCAASSHKTLHAGALPSLEAGIVSGDDFAALHCLKALFEATAEVTPPLLYLILLPLLHP